MSEGLKKNIPTHIAIIMDGNGRWAKAKGLPRTAGHKKGTKVFGDIAKHCMKIGVKHLTVYAFSTENWKRPKSEVDSIMNLLKQYLKDLLKSSEEGARLKFIGSRENMPAELLELMEQAESKTENFDKFTVNIALNYGGRAEIVSAVKKIAEDVKSGKMASEEINEDVFSDYIYTSTQPDPDIIIRPGGEKRISNFLLWQNAYSELIFMDVLWPDFTEKDLDEAVEIYASRNRRYGG